MRTVETAHDRAAAPGPTRGSAAVDGAAGARRPDPAAIITLALGTTLGLWVALYLLMVPGLGAPAWLAVAAIVGALAGAGVATGRLLGGGPRRGAVVGATIGVMNLLVLGGLLGGSRPGEVLVEGLIWIAGFFVLAVGLGAIGAAVGGRRDDSARPARDWTAALARLTVACTFVLLVAGGVVTGLEAGLAVPGWLTAFDYPLVLFPLDLMRSDAGVYAEHAHRLWGLLVGLSTLLLVIHLWRTRRRTNALRFAAVLLLAVIIQGTLGGTRVTEQSVVLAIAHGVFGQVVFAGMVALAVVVSRRYTALAGAGEPVGRAARWATVAVPAALVVQLMLGAMYRHLNAEEGAGGAANLALAAHVAGAIIVGMLAVIVGMRHAAAGSGEGDGAVARPRRLHAGALLVIVPLQIALGIAALVVVLIRGDGAPIPAVEVVVTTAHHATGALLLAAATALAVWVWGGALRASGAR